MLLDTARRIETPEGIELSMPVAGPVPRALAWLIDLLIRGILLLFIAMLLGALREIGAAALILSAFLLEWLFPAWCEVRFAGATPGKKIIGLRVLHDDGTPVRWPAAMTRNLLRAVDFLPFLYGFGLGAMLMNRDFKRLGDLAAGTLVVYSEPRAQPIAVPVAQPLAAPVALRVEEQRAVLDFAERAQSLTDARAEELAELAAPLHAHLHGSAAERLIRIANHLVGRA